MEFIKAVTALLPPLSERVSFEEEEEEGEEYYEAPPLMETDSYEEEDDDDDVYYETPLINAPEGEGHGKNEACEMSVEETDGTLILTDSNP